eukprot:scaffold2712_cov159-Isochrysis_galbana.AAC.1
MLAPGGKLAAWVWMLEAGSAGLRRSSGRRSGRPAGIHFLYFLWALPPFLAVVHCAVRPGEDTFSPKHYGFTI